MTQSSLAYDLQRGAAHPVEHVKVPRFAVDALCEALYELHSRG